MLPGALLGFFSRVRGGEGGGVQAIKNKTRTGFEVPIFFRLYFGINLSPPRPLHPPPHTGDEPVFFELKYFAIILIQNYLFNFVQKSDAA